MIFAVAFSLASLPGPLASIIHFPAVPFVHASPAPCSFIAGPYCSENFLPAGAATNTEIASIFSSETSELTALLGKQIDLTDVPLPLYILDCFQQTTTTCPQIPGINPQDFYLTSRVSTSETFELQFLLSNSYWGVNFHFGQDVGCALPASVGAGVNDTACPGVSIRQAFAHLVDKVAFVANAPQIAGHAVALDNDVPPSDSLVSPNPCSWDSLFRQTGAQCVVGSAGGTAYHFGSTTGIGHDTLGVAATYPWEPAVDNGGKADLCAAAQHLVTAGVATGFSTSTCVLTGISANASFNPVDIFVRSDRPARLALGDGLFQDVCYLFTGHFSDPTCQQIPTPTNSCSGTCYVTEDRCGFSCFPGFASTGPCLKCWQIYTGGFSGVFPFATLLYDYNSLFVDNLGSLDVPPCSTLAVPTTGAINYMFACIPAYDSISNQMEFSPCLGAVGDPFPGQTIPTFANCPGTTKLSAVSAGYQTEDLYGQMVITVPVYDPSEQFGYLSSWNRAINNVGSGLPSFFTWLNTYNTNFATIQTFKQGFAGPTRSLNPYAASTIFDFQLIGNIYDSLIVPNPLDNNQLMDWMTSSHSQQCNVPAGLPCDQAHLGYAPPAGTVATYRFTLRGDVFWQSDSVGTTHPIRPLTSWDVSFSYRTLRDTGSFQAGVLLPMLDIHVLDRSNFDINLNAIGPFTLFSITSPTIFPGRYWSATCNGATWDADVAAGSVPDTCRTVTKAMSTITFDPLASTPDNGQSPGILIGSSAFECQSSAGVVGSGCSSTIMQNPPAGGWYTLTRFGCNRASDTCNAPGANPTLTYFRSAGTLADYIWSGNNGDSVHDVVNLSLLANCFGKPAGTTGCTRWQHGILAPSNGIVDVTQISAAVRFLQDGSWIPSFNWIPGTTLSCCPFTSHPPTGVLLFPPVLYEGTSTLNPCSIDSINGYDC